ncbi:MAG: LacI family DNA-binding transcriptional regulator, partial [Planctomycetes bacterium]|nr:LacI family DNA-binding transcriptional regulator [Planctomycetota bacterium]
TRFYAGMMVEHMQCAEKPQAIMATTDSDVFPIAEACRLFGLTPGEDIDIVGYDNNWQDAPELAQTGYKPLATADKHNFKAGETMVKLLRQRQQNPQMPLQTVYISPEIILT